MASLYGLDFGLSSLGLTPSHPPIGIDTGQVEHFARLTEVEAQREAYIQRLRPNRDQAESFTGLIDHDDSGDWTAESGDDEPISNRAGVYRGPEQRRAEHEQRQERRAAEWEKILKVCEQHDHSQCFGVVRMRIDSERLRRATSALPDNWPNRACNTRPLARKASLWENDISEANIINTDRKTNARQPSEDVEFHIGHPQWQGCRGCARLGETCSIIHDDPRKWPCEACADTGEVCEMFRPPVSKRPCEACVALSLDCSFFIEPKDPSPCKECRQGQRKCIAGPTHDGFPSRHLTTNPATSGLPQVFASGSPTLGPCTHCTETGLACSLGYYEGDEPTDGLEGCENCKFDLKICDGSPHEVPRPDAALSKPSRKRKRENNVADSDSEVNDDPTFYVKERKRGKKKSQKRVILRSQSPPPGPSEDDLTRCSSEELFMSPYIQSESEEGDVDVGARESPKKEEKKKKKEKRTKKPRPEGDSDTDTAPDPAPLTRLFEPLVLNSAMTCSLCRSVKYTMLGRTTLTPITDLQSLPEYRGTHVCGPCTASRLNLLRCRHDDMVPYCCERPTPGGGGGGGGGEQQGRHHHVPLSAMIQSLFVDERRPDDPWCSLCPDKAVSRCQAPGAAAAAAGDGPAGAAAEEESDGAGCGLRLCGKCAKGIKRAGGSVEGFMEDTMMGVSGYRSLGMRADAELLKRSGQMCALLKAPTRKKRQKSKKQEQKRQKRARLG